MYIDEIRALSTDEILDKIEDLKVEMYTFRIQKESGELKDTTLFRKTRRDIARLKTALRERELAAELVARKGERMPNNRKRLVGTVVSDKMEKTVVVAIENRKMHPVYHKVVTSTKKVMAHDETGAGIGALVRIVQSRPISKRKRWVVEAVLEDAESAGD